MDQLAMQGGAAVQPQAGVRQVHRQDRVVLLHVGAEKQQRGSVEAELEPRQISGVVVIDAVGTPRRGDDVAAPIKYREGEAVLEGANAPLLERDVRFDVER